MHLFNENTCYIVLKEVNLKMLIVYFIFYRIPFVKTRATKGFRAAVAIMTSRAEMTGGDFSATQISTPIQRRITLSLCP